MTYFSNDVLKFEFSEQVLQNFMFGMLKDSNVTAAKMSLVSWFFGCICISLKQFFFCRML